MRTFNHWLIIAGNGRNVGKTSLACSIINENSKKNTIIGLKFAPHFHPIEKNNKLIYKNANFTISEELNKEGSKDSSRMLAAGAQKVFYIQSLDDHLEKHQEFYNFYQK